METRCFDWQDGVITEYQKNCRSVAGAVPVVCMGASPLCPHHSWCPAHGGPCRCMNMPSLLAVVQVPPPMVICVALDRTGGNFEGNLEDWKRRYNATEGVDYWHFC